MGEGDEGRKLPSKEYEGDEEWNYCDDADDDDVHDDDDYDDYDDDDLERLPKLPAGCPKKRGCSRPLYL